MGQFIEGDYDNGFELYETFEELKPKLSWITQLPQWELVGSIEAQNQDYFAHAYRTACSQSFDNPGGPPNAFGV